MHPKRCPRYVVSPKDGLAYRLLDTHTGNLVEFLETPSLEYISDVCWRHNRAWAGIIGLRSSSHQNSVQMTTAGRATRLASFWNAEEEKAQFAIAVRRLKQIDDAGETLPLHFTLPAGRSIESLCDRVAHLHCELSVDLFKILTDLATALSVPEPTINSYGSCAAALRAIRERLALPRDQRRLTGAL
jgi:hypothetical protein